MSLETRIKDGFERLATLVKGKQSTLVSGTNIKTINGASVLGSGDIVISGGSGLSIGKTRSIISLRV